MRAAAVTWRRAAGRARAPHGSARTPAVACRALSDKTVADMRLDHGGSGLTLSETAAGRDPLSLFATWFEAAAAHPDVVEANAMALATVDAATLRPSCRVVLMKGFDEHGFVWYTNYTREAASRHSHGEEMRK